MTDIFARLNDRRSTAEQAAAKLIDADLIQETDEEKVLTADERTSIAASAQGLLDEAQERADGDAALGQGLLDERAERLADVAPGDNRGMTISDERGYIGVELGPDYALLGGVEQERMPDGILRRRDPSAGDVIDELLPGAPQAMTDALVDLRGYLGTAIGHEYALLAGMEYDVLTDGILRRRSNGGVLIDELLPVVSAGILDAIVDERGFFGAEVGASYTLLGGIETDLTSEGILRRKTCADDIIIDEVLTVRPPGIAEALVDERGFIGWGVNADSTFIGGGAGPSLPEPELAPVDVTSLRRVRTKLALLTAGANTQLDIGYFGDSFVDGESRFLSALTRMLVSDWGDAGGGWTGFAWGSAGTASRGNARKTTSLNEYTINTLSQTGQWTHSNRDGGDPSMGHVETSTAGAFISLSGPATSQFALHYEGGVAAAIRYSWDAGSTWTDQVLETGSGHRSVDLAGGPSGAFALRIEHVSGTSRLYGMFYRSSSPGIRVSKYGNNGSHTGQWAAASPLWDQSIAAVPLDLAIITLGTNDQGPSSGVSPAQMADNIEVMVTRLRAAKPALDILVVMPPENLGARPTPMTEYAAAVGRWCRDNGVGWIDMQAYFGPDPAEYASTGPIPLWNPDNTHVGSFNSAQPGGALWARVLSDNIFSR